jgi:hypothetical protein
VRRRVTVGQHHLNRRQRLGNQRGSFAGVAAGSSLRRAPVWLVDDILTTMSFLYISRRGTILEPVTVGGWGAYLRPRLRRRRSAAWAPQRLRGGFCALRFNTSDLVGPEHAATAPSCCSRLIFLVAADFSREGPRERGSDSGTGLQKLLHLTACHRSGQRTEPIDQHRRQRLSVLPTKFDHPLLPRQQG